jgi:hypothetical protein
MRRISNIHFHRRSQAANNGLVPPIFGNWAPENRTKTGV